MLEGEQVREIKFRALDEQSKEWMYAGLKNGEKSFPLTVSNPLQLGLDDRFGDAYENTVWRLDTDELIWCQFTGLKDKNGVEIYEGDVLHDEDNDYIGVVSFEYGAFIVTWDNEFCNVFEWSDEAVIGNIYENPELLESK